MNKYTCNNCKSFYGGFCIRIDNTKADFKGGRVKVRSDYSCGNWRSNG